MSHPTPNTEFDFRSAPVGDSVGAPVGKLVGAALGAEEGLGVGAVVGLTVPSTLVGYGVGAPVVVVVDTPGLRNNTDSLAVGRRRKGSKAHLTPEMETDYPYIQVCQKRLH